jgi:hypothetical protein
VKKSYLWGHYTPEPQKRLTPKSEFLKSLERMQAKARKQNVGHVYEEVYGPPPTVFPKLRIVK